MSYLSLFCIYSVKYKQSFCVFDKFINDNRYRVVQVVQITNASCHCGDGRLSHANNHILSGRDESRARFRGENRARFRGESRARFHGAHSNRANVHPAYHLDNLRHVFHGHSHYSHLLYEEIINRGLNF